MIRWRAWLVIALGVATMPLAPAPVAGADTFPERCARSTDFLSVADDLLENRYLLPPHPVVTLSEDLTWAEDPLQDVNWQFQLHGMRYVLDLLQAWHGSGDSRYLDRALLLLQDWLRDNPRSNPPSEYSWDDHATAFRAVVLACTAELVPMTPWLNDALQLHGATLADPAFYQWHGNHALNQSIALLEVGRVLGHADWVALAGNRINALVGESVDTEGVTNEQAVGYQTYNYQRYRHARERLLDVGLTPSPDFARVDLMPNFLGKATLPNGQVEMIGDTEATAPEAVPGTWAEFMATQGASGPAPPRIAAYRAGYLFAHGSFGTRRAFRDETFLSVRWGPGRQYHGHPDGASMTLYGWGSRLLLDPGIFTYAANKWRTYARSRQAHNVVTVDGPRWDRAAPTTLLGSAITSRMFDVRLRTSGYSGVTHHRRITWSRRLDYAIVEDRLTSRVPRTYRQLWHLVQGSNLAVGTTTVRTRRDRGNVMIRQLVGSPTLRIVKGSQDPVQGWISYRYGRWVAAPVVQAVRTGTSVRYLTLIVVAQGRPRASTTGLRLTSDGYRVTVTIDGRSERVVANGSTISISLLGG